MLFKEVSLVIHGQIYFKYVIESNWQKKKLLMTVHRAKMIQWAQLLFNSNSKGRKLMKKDENWQFSYFQKFSSTFSINPIQI